MTCSKGVDLEEFPAVRVLTNELMGSLFWYTWILLAIVVLTLLIALVTGPYPWAVGLRRWFRDVARGLTAGFGGEVPDTGRVRGTREHRDALGLSGACLAVALLFLVDLSLWGFLIVAIALGLFEIAVFRLGREPGPDAVQISGSQGGSISETTTPIPGDAYALLPGEGDLGHRGRSVRRGERVRGPSGPARSFKVEGFIESSMQVALVGKRARIAARPARPGV